MPLLGFAPDAPSNSPGIITDCQNWIPYEAGMEAAPTLADVGAAALAAACTGAATVLKTGGTIRTFAGTATELYELEGTAWTRRSSATYTATSEWSFAQFGDVTIASNGLDAMQQSTAAAFSDITGPKAEIVESVVTGAGGFVFAFNTNDGVNGTQPDRWWCSALNDHADWTPSVSTQCTTGRLIGPGGPITAGKKFGADSIVAYKAQAMFHGRYVGGSTVWAFQEIPTVGCVGKRAVADIGFAHFIVAQDGFYLYDGARPQQVGTNKVRQWFARNLTAAQADMVECVYEQSRNRIWVFFPYSGNPTLNKALVYHLATGEWGLVNTAIETALFYIGSGVSMDAASGTFDAQTESFNSAFWTAAERSLAAFDTNHDLRAFSGIPATSYYATRDFGDPRASSRLTEAFLNYQTRPTTASCSAFASFGLGGYEFIGPTTTAHDEVGSASTPGRFTLRQYARWHRLQFDFTGPCQITDDGATWRPAGSR